MSDLEKIIEYLNKNIKHSIWYETIVERKICICTYFPELNIEFILSKLNNINISYTNEVSFTDGYRVITIKIDDVLNHIKAKEREDKINKILS